MESLIETLIKKENGHLEIAFDVSTQLFYGIIRDAGQVAIVSAENETISGLMDDLENECTDYLIV
ncbi:MAG: hypothetical protein E6Q97_15260 [Desulfurellales bacterium]|nr:MAG: hypothetical protein E6Q97_15260 [Desulfurellales bacterium]